ncbi:MAG: glycosyltransferase family 2 protein [Isosphaeraceae bacterium]
MASTLGLAAWLLTLFLTPMFGFLALVTAAALLLRRRGAVAGSGAGTEPGTVPARFVVLIPAHNEEANIGATVRSCMGVDYDPERFTVLVIADNCSDATARAAREAGAQVFERSDRNRRSKGYALEDVLEHLAREWPYGPYDAVVVIDADTLVDPALLSRFDRVLAGGDDWAQCYYTVRNPDASWRTRLLTYALSLFNGVWLLGQDRLRLSVGFRGNGMCFSARGLAHCPWRAYGLVEDQEFSWMLRAAGERVRFVPEARVYAEMVSRGRDAVSQRRRWEEGRKSLAGRFLRPVLGSRALGFWHKALSAVELGFPPLMKLFGLFCLALLVHPAALAFPGLAETARRLAPLHLFMFLTLAVYAVSPFLTLGLPARYMFTLAAIPYYAAWKVAATFGSRTTDWVRTRREAAA